jgi:HAD superfamily hydrolase (TIGR01549 family)
MLQAVIFDVDGTLIDTVDFHAAAWQRAFEHYSKKIDYEKVRSQIGKGSDQLLPMFFSKEELDHFGKEMEEFRGELYKREYLPRVQVFPKVRELFARIKGDGKQIVLASSAVGDELEHYRKITGANEFIEGATSADDAEKSKPHPDIFQAALDQVNDVKVAAAIVIGDTPYDVEAANKIDLRTIAVLSGGFSEEDLRRTGAIAIYRDVAHLLAEYESSPLAR